MSVTLIEITPNYFGPDRWYAYDGDLSSIREVEGAAGSPPEASGWLVRFRDVGLQQHCAAVYVDDGKIFADFGSGASDASGGQLEVSMRKFLNVSLISVASSGAPRETFVVVTPPWRYLSNDGRFPGAAEPICEAVLVLTDPVKADSFRESLSGAAKGV